MCQSYEEVLVVALVPAHSILAVDTQTLPFARFCISEMGRLDWQLAAGSPVPS